MSDIINDISKIKEILNKYEITEGSNILYDAIINTGTVSDCVDNELQTNWFIESKVKAEYDLYGTKTIVNLKDTGRYLTITDPYTVNSEGLNKLLFMIYLFKIRDGGLHYVLIHKSSYVLDVDQLKERLSRGTVCVLINSNIDTMSSSYLSCYVNLCSSMPNTYDRSVSNKLSGLSPIPIKTKVELNEAKISIDNIVSTQSSGDDRHPKVHMIPHSPLVFESDLSVDIIKATNVRRFLALEEEEKFIHSRRFKYEF